MNSRQIGVVTANAMSSDKKKTTNRKVEAALAMGVQNGPQIPFLEIFDDTHKNRTQHVSQVHSCDLLELRQLRTLVSELRNRQTILENELAQCKVLREFASRVPELEKELSVKRSEVRSFRRRIQELESMKHEMEEQMARYPALVEECEDTRAKLRELEKRNAQDIPQQCTRDKLKACEAEILELRRSNTELKKKTRDLADKLALAESQVSALGNLREEIQSEIVARVEAEASKLKHTNENLCKQVEGLTMDRFSETEELFYLHWLNSCLRHKLRNSDAASGRTLEPGTSNPLSQDVTSEQLTCEDNRTPSVNNLENAPSYSIRSSVARKLTECEEFNNDNEQIRDHNSPASNNADGRHVRTKPRKNHSATGMKEPTHHLKLQIKNMSGLGAGSSIASASAGPSISLSNGQVDDLSKFPVPKLNVFEQQNGAVSLIHVLRRTFSNELDDKYPLSKDKCRGLAWIAAGQATQAKHLSESKHMERCVRMPAEGITERRVLRIHKPPPKPSEITTGNILGKADEILLTNVPPPPPPPPPPLKSGRITIGASPPPPPPPPLKFRSVNTNRVQRAPQVVEFYQSLMKRDAKKDSCGTLIADTPISAIAHSNMIGEIENRSSHLLAIKTQVETQGDFVHSLTKEVIRATYNNMEDVIAFVKWLDDELSFLLDERAVLKHFDWPERKADAMREAAFSYGDLKKLEAEISSYECIANEPCARALKQMTSLLEKCEHAIFKLLRTKDLAMARYKEFRIPTDWMCDSGIVSKIKFASVKLAKKYMERVVTELESMKYYEKESKKEFLLLQGVQFAFRVHQFAGGLDAESMQAFEDLRNLSPRKQKVSCDQEYQKVSCDQ